jgi:Flp pilus assembly protein TadD
MKMWPLMALALAAVAAPLTATAPPGEAEELRTAIARGSVHALLDIGDRRAQRGDLQGAAEPLRRALALAPNSERALAAYARTAIAARAPGSALLALEPLARMHPTVVDYSYLLGVAWMQIGDMSSALPALERARVLDPNRELTLAALGIGLTQLKRFAEA